VFSGVLEAKELVDLPLRVVVMNPEDLRSDSSRNARRLPFVRRHGNKFRM